MELIQSEREAYRKERQELLNRIAVPEKRIIDRPEPREAPPAPRDEAEMAFVGGIVPEGVSVGYVGANDDN